MKIYEIGTGYTPIPAQMGAATEIVVEELTKAFRKQNREVGLIDIRTSSRRCNDLPITEVWVPGCFCGTDVQLGLMHKLKRVVYSVSLANTLAGILRSSQERVVLHFHNQYNLYFFCKLTPKALRRKAVIAYTNHSYIWHGKWEEIESVVRKRYFQEIYCVEHADHVFVLNEQTRENLLNHLNVKPEKVHLIDNGVNTEIYSCLPQEEKWSYAAQEELTGKTVFVQVGSVCDRKNQLEAVRLLLPLLKADPNMVYCYAGGVIDPEYKRSVERLAQDNGVAEQVRYFGELQPGEQLNAFYNSAEAMIFPSKAEGFSLVVMEAMSAGVPVVVNRELQFRLSGDCLRYSEDEEFLQIIKENILDPEARCRAAKTARASVLAGYSWDKVALDYQSIWSSGGETEEWQRN